MNCDVVALADLRSQSVIVCEYLSQVHWSLFLAPLAALFAIAVAIWGVRNARSVARQKATLDLIEKRESTLHYQILHEAFRERRLGEGFTALSNAQTPELMRTRKLVGDYLNHYELVAIGIKSNILDEQMYRDWMEGAFVRDFNSAADFIQSERWRKTADGKGWEYRATLFANYQWAAERWSPDARRLVEDQPPRDTPPNAPGDEPLPRSNPPI